MQIEYGDYTLSDYAPHTRLFGVYSDIVVTGGTLYMSLIHISETTRHLYIS